MAANLRETIRIEDLGNHSRQAVADLRCLLARGASKVADPKRHNFYEVESDSLVYYIHESPVTGKILLLATWQNENVPRVTQPEPAQFCDASPAERSAAFTFN